MYCVKAAAVSILVLNFCINFSECLAPIEARLVANDGSTVNVSLGRLEWNSEDRGWRSVCEYNFNGPVADVTCRQLGFNRASNYGRVGKLGLKQGTGDRFWISLLQCIGTETRLRDCSAIQVPPQTCYHYQDIGLNCTGVVGPTEPSVLDNLPLWTGLGVLGAIIIIFSIAAMILSCLFLCKGKPFKNTANARNEGPMRITTTTFEPTNEEPCDRRPLLQHQEPHYNDGEEQPPAYRGYRSFDPVEPGAPSAPMPEQPVDPTAIPNHVPV